MSWASRDSGCWSGSRDFAAELAEAAGELTELRTRHAAWYRDLAASAESALRAGDPEEIRVAALEAEIGNLWSAVAFRTGRWWLGDLVRSIVAALPMYWIMRGRFGEARSWLDRALDLDPTKDDLRRRLLSSLATIASLQGDHVVAVEAADEAADSSRRSLAARRAASNGYAGRRSPRCSGMTSRLRSRSTKSCSASRSRSATASARRRAVRRPGRVREPHRPGPSARMNSSGEPRVRAGAWPEPLRSDDVGDDGGNLDPTGSTGRGGGAGAHRRVALLPDRRRSG